MDMDFAKDIPEKLARTAFLATSQDPEKLGKTTVADYVAALTEDWEQLSEHADTQEKKAVLEDQFSRYREGYKVRFTKWLYSESRCMSWFVVGPANFPVARMEKYRKWAIVRSQECLSFRKWAKNEILKALHPEWRPIMAGDSDAQERLRRKIREAEEQQKRCKEANKAIRRSAKKGQETQKAVLASLGFTREQIAELLAPDYLGRVGVPAYALSNNNANIRRMKDRLAVIEKNQAAQAVEVKGEKATFEDCPRDNRVRLFFPGKPEEPVRRLLKSKGFRWTPSLGCWQAFRNPWSITAAKQVAGIREASNT